MPGWSFLTESYVVRAIPHLGVRVMTITMHRLVALVAGVVAVAFVTSGLTQNAKQGVGNVLGTVAWGTFLLGLPCLLVLVVIALVSSARRRKSSPNS
jgi:RsiW-degrading membrane proteinase PrsW (M82 family)